MNGVSVTTDGFVVDAGTIGAALEIPPADVQTRIRGGEITSRCEAGVDEDAGRWRLTFYSDGRAFRLVVNKTGKILSRATFPSHAPAPGPNAIETLSAKA